jgi:DNA-binding response OmpR family regulator
MYLDQSRILFIEDDLSLGKTIVDLLKINKYGVKWCKNGVEALLYLENSIPDIIICDLMMPIMSGEEFFFKVRKIKKLDKVPFIIITANVSFDIKISQLQNGVNDFITKPFKFQELLLKTKNFLDFKNKFKDQNQDLYHNSLIKYKKKNFFEKLNEIILKDVKLNLPIDTIAAELYVSKSTLYKKVKNFKNRNPSQYIREFKIEYTIKLIEDGETNVQVLAESAGFNSLSYFSICFKKYTKTAPKKYILANKLQ